MRGLPRAAPARQRQQPISLHPHRLIHHRTLHPHRRVATLRGRRQRLGHTARPAQLRLGRAERAVQRLNLLRVDRPLPVKSQLARRACGASKRERLAQRARTARRSPARPPLVPPPAPTPGDTASDPRAAPLRDAQARRQIRIAKNQRRTAAATPQRSLRAASIPAGVSIRACTPPGTRAAPRPPPATPAPPPWERRPSAGSSGRQRTEQLKVRRQARRVPTALTRTATTRSPTPAAPASPRSPHEPAVSRPQPRSPQDRTPPRQPERPPPSRASARHDPGPTDTSGADTERVGRAAVVTI